MLIFNKRENTAKLVCLLVAGLLGMSSIAMIAAADDEISSADLIQIAVDKMGDIGQEASVSGFDFAESKQIGYSGDGKVTQTISYDNIGNGSIMQWGESGDMTREERTLNLDNIGESGFTWQWSRGEVNQTIYVKNADNLYLKQIVGGLKHILFPDPKAPKQEQTGSFTLCGKPVNSRSGLPLCAEKIAQRVFNGKASARDYYMLQYLAEDYGVFPSVNLTPHVTLTKWNITRENSSLIIKFRAQNFGRKGYNATLMLDVTPKNKNILDVDGNARKVMAIGDVIEFKAENDVNIKTSVPDTKTIEVDKYTVPSLRGIERTVVIPMKDMNLKSLEILMVSE
jgi:hypothetical protein